MKKYTIKSIKKTNVYKSNIEAVNAIYPGHGNDFARELMIVANGIDRVELNCTSIASSFTWHYSPQLYLPWCQLHQKIRNFNDNKSVKK